MSPPRGPGLSGNPSPSTKPASARPASEMQRAASVEPPHSTPLDIESLSGQDLEFADQPRRRRWRLAVALVVIVAASAVGIGITTRLLWSPVEVHTTLVDWGPVEESLTEDGIVRPLREAQISADIPGRIRSIEVEEGQHVEAGQVLFTLEAEHLEARIPSLEAQRDHAVRQAAEAEARRTYAQKQRQRAEELRQRSATSEQQYEQALSEFQIADAQYQATLANIQRIDAELKEARTQLARSVARAPFAGVVDSIELEAGELISIGFGDFAGPGTVAVTLIDISDRYVEAEIAEADVGRVRSGQTVQITTDAHPNEVYHGVIERIQLHARPKEILTRYERAGEEKVFLAKVRLDEPAESKAELRPGLTVYVSIRVDQKEGVRAPRQAIWAEGDQLVAYVVRDGRARRRNLEIGLKGEEFVQVRSGLETGQQVILRGNEPITDGVPVKVVGASEPQMDASTADQGRIQKPEDRGQTSDSL